MLRLAQAEADYQNAISGKQVVSTGVNTTRNNIAVSDASLQESKILLDNAERDYNRYKNLFAQDAVTRQQYDKMETAYPVSYTHLPHGKYGFLPPVKVVTDLQEKRLG